MKGRVIVFVNEGAPDPEPIRVYAIPDDWDDDDIHRHIGDDSNWTTVAVTDVKEVALT